MTRKNFIQNSIKRPGRVHSYLERVYGSRAFNWDGTIKMSYLSMAEKRAKAEGNRSLVDALNEAKTLKRLSMKKMKA